MMSPTSTLQGHEDRLYRLEEAYAEIFRLPKALASSGAACYELELQVVLLSSSLTTSSITPTTPTVLCLPPRRFYC